MQAPEIRLRESPRVLTEARARLSLPHAGVEVPAIVLDLSTSGMGLATRVAAPMGEMFRFELEDGDRTIQGRAMVVWSRRPRPDREDAPNLGARFIGLDEDAMSAIEALVERKAAALKRPLARSPRVAPTEPGAVAPEDPVAVTTAPAVAPTPSEPVGGPRVDAAVAPRRFSRGGLAGGGAAVLALVLATIFLATGDRQPGTTDVVSGPRSPSAGTDAAVDPPAAGGELGSGAASPGERPAAAVPPEPRIAEPEPHLAAPEPRGTTASAEPLTSVPAEPAAAAPRARRILAIEPATDGDETVVTIRADGTWRESDVFAALIGPDPPRYLLRLTGIERLYRPTTIDVGAAALDRVRIGHHDTRRGPELHVVLDLPTRAVAAAVEREEATLRVRLRPAAP